MMLFGKTLKKMRKGAGMTQEHMALELDMSISNISRLETDRYVLKAEDLIKWCRITNHPEILMTLIYGAEVVSQISGAVQFVSTIFLGVI